MVSWFSALRLQSQAKEESLCLGTTASGAEQGLEGKSFPTWTAPRPLCGDVLRGAPDLGLFCPGFTEVPDGQGRGRVVRAKQAAGQRYNLERVAP